MLGRIKSSLERLLSSERRQPCDLCLCKVPASAFASTGRCGHGACGDCLRGWVSAEAERIASRGGLVTQVRCPMQGCLRPLSRQELRPIADPAQLAHLDDLALRQGLREMPDFEFCPRCPDGGVLPPAAACRSYAWAWLWLLAAALAAVRREVGLGLAAALVAVFAWRLATGRGAPTVICRSCSFQWVPAALRRRSLLAAGRDGCSEAWKSLFAMRCPQCAVITQRNGGCRHIICLRCAEEWCFSCGGRWQSRGHQCKGDALLSRLMVVPLAALLQLHPLLIVLIVMAAVPLRRPRVAWGLAAAGATIASASM